MASPRPRWWDVLLAGGAAGALVADGMTRRHGAALPLEDYALAAATCLPLAWRSVAPLLVLLASLAGLVACLAAFKPYDTAILVVMIPLYTVAVLGGRARSLGVGAGARHGSAP
jgi:hypothetical protein